MIKIKVDNPIPVICTNSGFNMNKHLQNFFHSSEIPFDKNPSTKECKLTKIRQHKLTKHGRLFIAHLFNNFPSTLDYTFSAI